MACAQTVKLLTVDGVNR